MQTPAMFGTLSFRKNAVDDPSVAMPLTTNQKNWKKDIGHEVPAKWGLC